MGKGLDAPTIIAIIVAIIIGIVIIYFAWSKGFLSFLGLTTESQCKTDLMKACSGQLDWEKISKGCVNYIKYSIAQTNLNGCITSSGADKAKCDEFCSWFSAQTQ
jgi:hypothetical protein